MTTPQPVAPPRPPFGSSIKIKDGQLEVGQLWQKWARPAAQVTVQTIDQTGQRVTLTRVATLGVFALGAKKKTGHITLVFSTPAGETKQHRVPANLASHILAWAVAFNAWQQGQQG